LYVFLFLFVELLCFIDVLLAGFQQSTFWGFLLQNLAKIQPQKKIVASWKKKHAKFWRKQNKILGFFFFFCHTSTQYFQFTSFKEFGQFSTNDFAN